MIGLLHSSHMTSFNQSVGSNYWLVCLPLVHEVTTQNSQRRLGIVAKNAVRNMLCCRGCCNWTFWPSFMMENSHRWDNSDAVRLELVVVYICWWFTIQFFVIVIYYLAFDVFNVHGDSSGPFEFFYAERDIENSSIVGETSMWTAKVGPHLAFNKRCLVATNGVVLY